MATFRSLPSSADAEIHRRIVADGFNRVVAARLIEFLPMAYSRLVLGPLGVRFSKTFLRKSADESISAEQPLSSEPVWNWVLGFARYEVKGGVKATDLLAVAARSAEFDAANQLQNKGSRPSDLVMTPALLSWPKDGPDPRS